MKLTLNTFHDPAAFAAAFGAAVAPQPLTDRIVEQLRRCPMSRDYLCLQVGARSAPFDAAIAELLRTGIVERYQSRLIAGWPLYRLSTVVPTTPQDG